MTSEPVVFSLEDLLEMPFSEFNKIDEGHLPSFVDKASIVTEEDYQDFTSYAYFVVPDKQERNKDPFENLRETKDFSSKNYFLAGFGSIAPTISLHEMLHAFFAKITGGEVFGFAASGEGICTLVSTPDTFSYITTLVAPNFVLSTLGLFLLQKGYKEGKGLYAGLGVTLAFGGVNYMPVPRGDFFSAINYLIDLSPEYVSALTVGAVALNYATAYLLSNKVYSISNDLKKSEEDEITF